MTVADQVQVAYTAFIERVAAAVGDDAATQRVADSFAQYTTIAQTTPTAAAPAFDTYRAVLAETVGTDRVRPLVGAAFSRFVAAVGAAWPQGAVEPGEVAAAADTLLAGAWIAGIAAGAPVPAPGSAPGSEPGTADAAHPTGTEPIDGVIANGFDRAISGAFSTNGTHTEPASGWGPTSLIE